MSMSTLVQENSIPTGEIHDNNTAAELTGLYSAAQLLGVHDDARLAERYLVGQEIDRLRGGKSPACKSDAAAFARILSSAVVMADGNRRKTLQAILNLAGQDISKPAKAFGRHSYVTVGIKRGKEVFGIRPDGLRPSDTLPLVNQEIAEAKASSTEPTSPGEKMIKAVVGVTDRLMSEGFAFEGFQSVSEYQALLLAVRDMQSALATWDANRVQKLAVINEEIAERIAARAALAQAPANK